MASHEPSTRFVNLFLSYFDTEILFPFKTIKRALKAHPLNLRFFVISLICICYLMSGCSEETSQQTNTPTPKITESVPAEITLPQELVDHLRAIGQKSLDSFQQAENLAVGLASAIETFNAQPDEEKLTDLKRLWGELYLAYQNGLINSSLDPASIQRITQRLNQWPIEPGYVDRLPLYPNSGIISDPFVEINEESLRKQHGLTHEFDVTLGFQPLAFLLWGEPGLSKFVSDDSVASNQNNNPNLERDLNHQPMENVDTIARRKSYLVVLATVLQADIKHLVEKQKTELEALKTHRNPISRLIQITKQQTTVLDNCYQRSLSNDEYLYYSDLQQSQLEACLASLGESWSDNTRTNLSQIIKPLKAIEINPAEAASWQTWLTTLLEEVDQNRSVTMQTALEK